VTSLPAPGSTARTRIKRVPDKEVTDRARAYAILDAGFVAHVAVETDGQPYVVPVAYARRGDEVIFHGSSASRLFKTLAAGQPTCLTVTLLDGMVLARSLFESSMHYRTVMVLGQARQLEGQEEFDALLDLSEHLLPGRSQDARLPLPQELKATITLALLLDEISVKVGSGPPEDVPEDLSDPDLTAIWAGYVPLVECFGEPVADELAATIPIPDYIRHWTR
jgi:uncharacterized protein